MERRLSAEKNDDKDGIQFDESGKIKRTKKSNVTRTATPQGTMESNKDETPLGMQEKDLEQKVEPIEPVETREAEVQTDQVRVVEEGVQVEVEV